MVKTIGNPLSWAAQGVSNAGHAMGDATGALGGTVTTPPQVRQITNDDLRRALRKGYADFARFRSDVMFLGLIYPVIGLCLAAVAFHQALLPMLFPLGAGFVLLGPIAAIGLYELSRQAETRKDVGWRAAFSVLSARNIGPVLVMALYLLGLFLLWLLAAMQIYNWTLGPAAPASAFDFAIAVFTTVPGWAMIGAGMATGFVFAALVLVISLTTLPMIVDQRVGLPVAVMTSVHVARKNPATVARWGLIVAVLMLLGSLPLFLGLVIVLPILGHATWHLYCAAVPR
ncbi:DUF2189 domain-containing protein [Roseovarius gahaiensis]|uniref:DUF2189 domain-containing protein n=1 Tax=Roseovarius gahaiensis TaxID=2716691 RepID=A0A967BDC5_9RHOB|nr:DUF2189 domain-containing protein [Roseovarius gahaiensis]NHQ75952.1 DUF2189 domain-containing protein [Roseovarius gahaiensis]